MRIVVGACVILELVVGKESACGVGTELSRV
jgi:hypothetical protein